MSRRTQAISSARGAAKAAGGSHLTVQARQGTLERMVQSAWNRGQQVTGIDGLKERHVAEYFRERQAQGISARTLQNEISHMRTSMAAAGRNQAAASPGIATRALGIEAASRAGTREPATAEQAHAAFQAAAAKDAGLGATVKLQQALGLRAQEAIRSGMSLATWASKLERGEKITVIFGTKGGRAREVSVVDRAAALNAVHSAQAVADGRGGHLLPGTLKQADTLHRNAWHREIGPASSINSHQLRAAFALARVGAYETEGFTRREALARTSLDLGHGDGRGRWVERVYLAKA